MIPINIVAEVVSTVAASAAAGTFLSSVRSWLKGRDRRIDITVTHESGEKETISLSGSELSEERLAEIVRKVSSSKQGPEPGGQATNGV